MVSVGTMGLCWSGMALSWLGGLVGCVWGWGFGACGSRLPGLAFSGWAGDGGGGRGCLWALSIVENSAYAPRLRGLSCW